MRNKLITEIETYKSSQSEEKFKPDFINLIRDQERCFYRDVFAPGHITGSALLINIEGTRILMNHHKILNKWLCFGGHADGDENTLEVARREVMEESGINDIEPVLETIFDLDIHPIPENVKKGEPDHLHFDVRYLFRAGRENFKLSDESLSLKWCSFDEAEGMDLSSGMRRLIQKARNIA